MIDIRQILCPVDFSDASRRGLDHAAALAGWYRATITALYVFSPPALLVQALPQRSGSLLRDDARAELLGRLRTVLAEVAGDRIPAQALVAEGGVAAEIERQVQALPADLIVMGTQGRGGLERFVLGSVAERVLRHSSVPVLTVPPESGAPPQHAATFKNIVCAVDFSPASEAAMEYALSLAQEAGGTLTLLHVIEWFPAEELRMYAPDDLDTYRQELEVEAMRKLAAAIPDGARDWCRPVNVVAFGSAGLEVLRLARQWQADLIVIGVRGRNAGDLLIFGSTAQAVLREAPCPVLTLRSE